MLARNEKNSIIHPIEEGMVVATDAVSARGRVRARSLLVESVADAEFWAVEMALATWAGKTPVLHILTDSQIVYKALNDVEEPAGCRNSLRACAKRMERTEVFVHWVRGHRGNVLNELANDVAMYTRRKACWARMRGRRRGTQRNFIVGTNHRRKACHGILQTIPCRLRAHRSYRGAARCRFVAGVLFAAGAG